jgi:two-component system nitrogen regulation response regulator GlnG
MEAVGGRHFDFGGVVGLCPAMQQIFKLVGKMAASDLTVLIKGESGTGKELLAKAIHYNSRRLARPFVAVNCAAIPRDLLESELFGHEKGAFTGASALRRGKFELAEGGTLFLDEIGDMDLGLQAKILRVLQERQFERVGGERQLSADVRVIAATNQDLETAVAQKAFREDLYYRLNVVAINLPPLRERSEDIPLLVNHFLHLFAEEQGQEPKTVSPEALEWMLAYSWPGNVRELENAVKRACVLSATSLILPEHLPAPVARAAEVGAAGGGSSFERMLHQGIGADLQRLKQEKDGQIYSHFLAALERPLLLHVLERTGGNQLRAAELLGINRNTLRKKLRELGIKPGGEEDEKAEA